MPPAIKISLIKAVTTLISILAVALLLANCVQKGDRYQVNSSRQSLSAKYIFYLHSKIIEAKGPFAKSKLHGAYNYYGILQSLEDKGFHLISEVRQENTQSYVYAQKIVGQIETLLKTGVPPENITVAGLLKGGVISFYVSAILKNPKINYVILSGCGTGNYKKAFYNVMEQTGVGIEGEFLSIYDSVSPASGSCQPIFDLAAGKIVSQEVSLFSGLGTGLFYSPASNWIDPMVEWINKD